MSDTADTLSVLTSAEQIQANYEKYKSNFTDSTEELVNSETFLSLLVAEMTNQDPLEPTSNTDFITQMAQFTSLNYSKDAAEYAKSNYASSLVGKTVTASKADGSEQITKTGVVESVSKSDDSYIVKIDGVSFDISKITSISETTASSSDATETTVSTNTLGELITRASMMIGMSATVSAEVDGGSVLDSGLITSIQVKDGQVMVIINDTGYSLEDIVEVAYPTVEATDEDSAAEEAAADSTYDSAETAIISTAADTVTEETETLAAAQSDSSDVDEVIGEIIPDSEDSEDIEDLVETEDMI